MHPSLFAVMAWLLWLGEGRTPELEPSGAPAFMGERPGELRLGGLVG
jgi:hypothetical protein